MLLDSRSQCYIVKKLSSNLKKGKKKKPLQITYLIRVWHLKDIKNSNNSTQRQSNLKNGQRTQRLFSKKHIQVASKHMKRCSMSLVTAAAGAAKSLQSCPTLCDLIDGSPPGSPVPGILQARTLEWVAISFSNA